MNAELLCGALRIEGRVRDAAMRASERVKQLRYPAQEIVAANALRAFLDEGIAQSDLAPSAGYGYDDAARERYESLLARVFGAQRALARLSLVSGTHAIVVAIEACVAPGETLLSISGPPYDTLRNAIADAPDALVQRGVRYREIALRNGEIDEEALRAVLERERVAAVFIQRSRGYAPRPALSVAACERAAKAIKGLSERTLVLVDNCYGELVEEYEPSARGADLIMGSLIKNPGGSLASGGAYVAGRADLVERVASRHYAPGLGGRVGPSYGFGRAMLQGLFIAPLVVEQTLRGLDFAAALFEELGFEVDPRCGTRRTDIVQAIRLGSPEMLLHFAQGLQSAMPLDARFRPEPGAVPGYSVPVVMSSGAFVPGATIELSCDAPMRAPYEVYLQGGVSMAHAAAGALLAAARCVQG